MPGKEVIVYSNEMNPIMIEYYSIVCIYHISFIHSPADGHSLLSSFAVMNNVMNFGVQVSF